MAQTIIFDWDGTLFDVFDFLVETYTAVFEKAGLKPWTRKDYQNRFRCDWKNLLGEMGLENDLESLLDTWNNNKTSREKQLVLHEKAMQTIRTLSKTHVLAIVSSAPRHVLDAETVRLGVKPFMKLILSADDVENQKPDPEPLLKASSQLGVNPCDCVYVGDMREDIQAAKKAGMRSIAVTWGIHSPEVLEIEKPDKICETFGEIIDYIVKTP